MGKQFASPSPPPVHRRSIRRRTLPLVSSLPYYLSFALLASIPIHQVNDLLVNALGFGFVARANGIRGALLQIVAHHFFADAPKGFVDRGNLLENVEAEPSLGNHPLEAAYLPFHPLDP